jgi:hypothetical protein
LPLSKTGSRSGSLSLTPRARVTKSADSTSRTHGSSANARCATFWSATSTRPVAGSIRTTWSRTARPSRRCFSMPSEHAVAGSHSATVRSSTRNRKSQAKKPWLLARATKR